MHLGSVQAASQVNRAPLRLLLNLNPTLHETQPNARLEPAFFPVIRPVIAGRVTTAREPRFVRSQHSVRTGALSAAHGIDGRKHRRPRGNVACTHACVQCRTEE
jgi:hypothetical protein